MKNSRQDLRGIVEGACVGKHGLLKIEAYMHGSVWQKTAKSYMVLFINHWD